MIQFIGERMISKNGAQNFAHPSRARHQTMADDSTRRHSKKQASSERSNKLKPRLFQSKTTPWHLAADQGFLRPSPEDRRPTDGAGHFHYLILFIDRSPERDRRPPTHPVVRPRG